jgi:hypothetical protein
MMSERPSREVLRLRSAASSLLMKKWLSSSIDTVDSFRYSMQIVGRA